MKSILRRAWPDSLAGQLFMILCLSLLLLQAGNLLVVGNIQDSYFRQTNYDKVRNASSLYVIILRRTSENRAAAAEQYTREQSGDAWNITVTVLPELGAWEPARDQAYAAQTLERLRERLAVKEGLTLLEMRLRILERSPSLDSAPDYVRTVINHKPPPVFPLLEIAMQMDDGAWLSVLQPLGFNDTAILWMQRAQLLAFALVLAGVLLVILKKVTRPLRSLGEAAESFGCKPEGMLSLPEIGSREVREAAHSFNLMRKKIQDNLDERDRMLVAMGHDLRTPLTRLQLRLEGVEDESLRHKLLANCSEIKAIVQHSLELARSRSASEEPVDLDVGAFLESLAEDAAAAGQHITWMGISEENGTPREQPFYRTLRPLSLRRCLGNLLDNAWRYGGKSEIRATVLKNSLDIDIIDNGPGIAEEELAKVFEPYYRVEASRNRNSGGAGLGLAIARNMAILNGGELSLSNNQGRGLLARLSLPIYS